MILHRAAPALLLLLAACAGGPPASPAPGLEGPGAAAERNLFISPAGKPYRGKPGEAYPSAAWFAEADADHDGRLSRAEFDADSLAYFRLLDTDHDGVVDGFEIAAYERGLPEILPRVAALRAGEGQDLTLGRRQGDVPPLIEDNGAGRARRGRGGDGRQGAGLFSFLDQPEPLTVADTDFDSRVTLVEARAAAERRFTLLDTNHDGYLTLAELPKTPVQAFAERQAGDRRRSPGGARVEQSRAPAQPRLAPTPDRTR